MGGFAFFMFGCVVVALPHIHSDFTSDFFVDELLDVGVVSMVFVFFEYFHSQLDG